MKLLNSFKLGLTIISLALLQSSSIYAQDCNTTSIDYYTVTYGTNGTDGRIYDPVNNLTTFFYTVAGQNVAECGKLKWLMFETNCQPKVTIVDANPIYPDLVPINPEFFLDSADDFFGLIGVRWYGGSGHPGTPVLVDYFETELFSFTLAGNIAEGPIMYGKSRLFNGWKTSYGTVTGPACPYCGDGLIQDGEECDDGNNQAGDGCDASCQEETPVQPTPTPSSSPSPSPSPSESPTPGPSATPTDTATPVITPTPGPSASPEPSPTDSPDEEITPESTPTPQPVDCKDFSLDQVLPFMDGRVASQGRSIKAALRQIGKLDSQRIYKKFRKVIRKSAGKLQSEAWALTWSLPEQGTVCTPVPANCVQSFANSGIVEQFKEKSSELHKLMKKALRKLKQAGASKRILKQLRKREKGEFSDALDAAAQVPLEITEC